MNKYLTTKLAEEGSEVAQAACKVLLGQGKMARRALIREMADARAIQQLCMEHMTKAERVIFDYEVNARFQREIKKGKA